MPNYRHIVTQAYREVLQREPDPQGLEDWNKDMQPVPVGKGLTEAQVREAFRQSPEYIRNFPDEVVPPIPHPPIPGGPMALTVQGPHFVTSEGNVVRLQGIVACCADADGGCFGTEEAGWPLVNETLIDYVAAHHQNLVIPRLGPFVSSAVHLEGEDKRTDVFAYPLVGGKYDLDRWDPEYWPRLAARCKYALDRGVYYMANLIDVWAMQHRCSPWNADLNHQGWEGADLAVLRSALLPRHEAFVRAAVAALGGYDNVIWGRGNETFKGTSRAWLTSLRDIIRDEETKRGYPHRPIGTNAQNEELERVVDFGDWHELSAPTPTSYPRITTEYDDQSPDAVLMQVRGAWATGGAVGFQYWRGGHNCEDFTRVTQEIEKLVLGGDAGIPESCPPLCEMGLRIYSVLDAGFQLIDAPAGGWKNGQTLPPEAHFVIADSTPRFGSGRGQPCNAEHNEECGGRLCEDPRGQMWTLEEGETTHPLHLQSDDFQCRVTLDNRGHYRLRARPKPDARDYYGKPLTVTPDAAAGSIVEWTL